MLGKLIARRYKIISHLGEGGFSQTYLAEDTQLPGNPRCVVKQFKPMATDPITLKVARRLFDLEAKTLQQLGKHDQIPQLFAYCEENQEFYLVQEFISGHLLSQELVSGKRLNEFDLIALLTSILKPLAFVHQYNVIHRDIKPSNLIRRQQDGEIVLIDFGAVKQLAATSVVNAQGKTELTCVIGTRYYMPREQSMGSPRLSSDIYAVGMIGIQALTGEHPRNLPRDLPTDSQTERVNWRNLASVSDQLAEILDRMTCPDWSNRYQSVGEILQELSDLREFLNPLTQGSAKSSSNASTHLRNKVSTVPPDISQEASSPPNIASRSESSLSTKSFLARYPLRSIAVVLATALVLGIGVSALYELSSHREEEEFKLTPNPSVKASDFSLAGTIEIPAGAVWSLAISPDGQTLASGSDNKTIELYELKTRKLLRTLTSHGNVVRSVGFSPDGSTLVSGSGNGTIKVWNRQTGALEQELLGHSGPIWSVAVSPDGQTLVSGSGDQTIKVWDLKAGKLTRNLFGHSARVFSVAFAPSGKIFASGSADKTIKIWNLQTGKLLRTIERHKDAVRAIAISPDGKYLVSASWDNTVKVWEWQTGKLIHTLEGHADRVASVAVTADSRAIASGSVDNSIKLWNLQEGSLIRTLEGHSNWVLALAASPTEQLLVSSSKDQTIKIWKEK
ncbi:MAG: protein kinase [Xenococcaceae cyanobacterium]